MLRKHNYIKDDWSHVRENWALLEYFLRKRKSAPPYDEETLQRALRDFAVEVVRQQPYHDKIVVGNKVFMTFPTNHVRFDPTTKKYVYDTTVEQFDSKEQFLSHQSKLGNWGEDALLVTALEALGYQPKIYLANTDFPPYAPFVQQCSEDPLLIEIINYGATTGGTHWERKGQKNNGGGNCMFYTVAQQIQKDYDHRVKELKLIDDDLVMEKQENMSVIQNQNRTIAPVSIDLEINEQIRKDNKIVRQIEKESESYEAKAQLIKNEARNMLETFTTAQLAVMYAHAQKFSDYLPGRLDWIAQEHGLDPENNIFRQAIETGTLDQDSEWIIREEFLHALSTEAWRDKEHYNTLVQLTSTKNTTTLLKSSEQETQHTGELTNSPDVPFKHTLKCGS